MVAVVPATSDRGHNTGRGGSSQLDVTRYLQCLLPFLGEEHVPSEALGWTVYNVCARPKCQEHGMSQWRFAWKFGTVIVETVVLLGSCGAWFRFVFITGDQQKSSSISW